MKRALIGGFLSLIGSIWALAIVFIAGNNLATSWNTKLGRVLSTVIEMDLIFLFVLSIVFMAIGIILMAIELFRKEN